MEILTFISTQTYKGLDARYIADVLQLPKRMIDDFIIWNDTKNKSIFRTDDYWVATALEMYQEGIPLKQISELVGYSVEGTRNKMVRYCNSTNQTFTTFKSTHSRNKEVLHQQVFYYLYVKDLEEIGLRATIEKSPYSTSTFLRKLESL